MRLASSGESQLVEWPDGSICRYREGVLDFWYDGGDPGRVRELWESLLESPASGPTAVGWDLVPDGSALRVEGELPRPPREILEVDIDAGGTPVAPSADPRVLSRLTKRAGYTIVDPATGLIWNVHYGNRWRMTGVGPGCQIWPTSTTLWIAGPSRSIVVQVDPNRGPRVTGVLPGRLVGPPAGSGALLSDGGRLSLWRLLSARDGYSWTPGREIQPITAHPPHGAPLIRGWEGWLLHRGNSVEHIPANGNASTWLAPPTAATYEAWSARGQIVAEPFEWTGPPGPFSVRGWIRAVGVETAGLTVHGTDAVRLTRGELAGEESTAGETGALFFPHAPLRSNRPLALTLEGAAVSAIRAQLRLSSRHFKVVAGERKDTVETETRDLGTLTLDLTIEDAGLVLVRGDQRLHLEPAWLDALRAAGVLDTGAEPPDLSRWTRRALARCRVQSFEDAPEEVLGEWLRMTERDRRLSGDAVPAFALTSGHFWEISDGQASRIRAALGDEHPLGAFATSGFMVEGPDPLAPTR